MLVFKYVFLEWGISLLLNNNRKPIPHFVKILY